MSNVICKDDFRTKYTSISSRFSVLLGIQEVKHLAAYIIADIAIDNPRTYEEYKTKVPATIARYSGKFLARGGPAENLEGDWIPKRVVIVEFENLLQAKRWWSSAEYEMPKALRQSAAVTNMIVVEGA